MIQREINFKAWIEEEKTMLPPCTVQEIASNMELKCVDSFKFLEFTGLKDKNGTDIYEGDILQYKTELGKCNIHKVYREKGGLVINSHNDDFYRKENTPFYEACADNQTSQYIEQCEVIGNIYEHPELLEQ